MKILVIGSGGREHALAWKCSTDKFIEKVFVAPGNAGTLLEEKIENISLDINNNEDVYSFCISNNIELVIVGPEDPLVNGLVDFLESKNIKVHERKIKPDELPNFEGCFLTGTAAEITPISQIAGNNYKVCDLILDLSASYGKLVRKKKAA